MMRIAVTGGIAAGKSTVVNHLRSLGAFVIDYDVLARKVVEPGSKVLQEIVRVFGNNAITGDGYLNRAFIADCIFGDDSIHKQALNKVESIIHPAIYDCAKLLEKEYISRISKENLYNLNCFSCVIVHDIPLLAQVVDTIPFKFDYILTVEAPKDIRVARILRERNMTEIQALARINNQIGSDARKSIANYVVDSTKPIDFMLKSVEDVLKSWLLDVNQRDVNMRDVNMRDVNQRDVNMRDVNSSVFK